MSNSLGKHFLIGTRKRTFKGTDTNIYTYLYLITKVTARIQIYQGNHCR